MSDQDVRLTVWVRGRVQGVGFRWWVRSRALELGLVGHAINLDDGRVQVVAEGPRASCETLLDLLDLLDLLGPLGMVGLPGETAPVGTARPGSVSSAVGRWSAAVGGLDGFSER